QIAFTITVDQSAEIMAGSEEAMRGENKPYLQPAQYYFNDGFDIEKAANWIKLADQGASAPHITYWKARILAKDGQKEEAGKTAELGVDLATKNNNSEYIRLNSQVLKSIK